MYGFTNKFAYKANSRTQSAEYDNILSKYIAPKLDRAARELLNDKRFVNEGDLTDQRVLLNNKFGKIFTQARKDVAEGLAGREGAVANMQRKVRSINSEIRAKAINAFRRSDVGKGFTGGIDDLSYAELMWVDNYATLYKTEMMK